MDIVAAVRLGDVLCVRHETRELLLRHLLRGIGDVAEIRGTSAGSVPAAIIDGTCGPQPRSADNTTSGSWRNGAAART